MNLKLKMRIRAELFRRALNGEFPTYEDFYRGLSGKDMKGQFPWQSHFDAIAKEERKLGYPDVTFLVHRKDPSCPFPSQVDFKSAKPRPTAAQFESLRRGTDAIIAAYCPGTMNYYKAAFDALK